MINASTILFAIAALGGLALIIKRIKNLALPMWLALAHGAVAAAALVILIIATAQAGAAGVTTLPAVLFVLAALGGLFLFSYQLRGSAIPIPVALIHGFVAAAGFVTLLVKARPFGI